MQKPNSLDPELPVEQVLGIVNKHINAHAVTDVEESGGEARAYYIDTDIVLKVQRPNRVRKRTSLEQEVFFLKQLSSFSAISIPQVFGYGRETDSIEYIVMSRMSGKALKLVNTEKDKRDALIFELGQMLFHIHNLPDKSNLTNSKLFPLDEDIESLKLRLLNPIHECAEVLSTKNSQWNLSASPVEIAKRASDSFNFNESCTLHSNPGPTHTFINPQNQKLTGLIDFGDAYISHPSNDLRRFPDPKDRSVLFKGYNSLKKANDDFMSVWVINQLTTNTAHGASGLSLC